MEPTSTRRILVCPLGWGLGHTSRDIPLVDALRRAGHTVIVAADRPQRLLIEQRFPGIETLHFPSLRVRFSRSASQLFPLLWVAVRLPFHNFLEHIRLRRMVRQRGVDWVISDNRYGLWGGGARSVIITHQLRVIPPRPFRWAAPVLERLLKRWLGRFDEVWVPDYADEESFAGILSRTNGLPNVCHIGTLSRFEGEDVDAAVFSGFPMVVVASGPEPHRSIFVNINLQNARRLGISCLVIEGRPENGITPRHVDGSWVVGHLPDAQFALAVRNAQYLVVRGGYSSIMDMLALGVSGLVVPTPGQTEQEYLAGYLSAKGLFRTVGQGELLDIDTDTMRSRKTNRIINNQLQDKIGRL